MGRHLRVEVVDDLDGTVLEQNEAETIAFAIDGSNYEIELSLTNALRFRQLLRYYVRHARPVPSGAAARDAAGPATVVGLPRQVADGA